MLACAVPALQFAAEHRLSGFSVRLMGFPIGLVGGIIATPFLVIGSAVWSILLRLDSSSWTINASTKIIYMDCKVGPWTVRTRRYDLSKVTEVILGAWAPGAPMKLVLFRKTGGAIELADDRDLGGTGYTQKDLLRVGQRVAKLLGVKFEEVRVLPASTDN